MAMCGGYPRAQNRALDLHDLRLLSIAEEPGEVRLRVSAYVHVSAGVPGRDGGTGWSQELLLVVSNGARLAERPAALPMWIADGALTLPGPAPEGLVLVPLPLDRSGEVLLDLRGDEGRLLLSGQGIRAEELSEARFVERVPAAG